MKIYRIIDNGTHVLATFSELKVLRLFYGRMQKRDDISDRGWIDAKKIK